MKKKFKKIYIEITNICNLHCPFCSVDNVKKQEMSLDDFKKVVSEVKKHTNYIYLHVKGEPLLHRQLKEILEVASLNGLTVNITTNATLLKEKKDIILSGNVHQMNISLQALVNFTLDEQKKYLDEVSSFLLDVSKNHKMYLSLRLWVENKQLNDFIISYLEEKLKIKIQRTNHHILENVYLSFDKDFVWPNLKNEVVSLSGRCLGAIDQIAILVNGDVVPCCLDSQGIMKLGNIFESSLFDILSKERYLSIRKGFNDNKVVEEMCQKCSYRLRFK